MDNLELGSNPIMFQTSGAITNRLWLRSQRFVWPQAASGTVSLTRAQLSMPLEGIDWRRPERTWDPQLSV